MLNANHVFTFEKNYLDDIPSLFVMRKEPMAVIRFWLATQMIRPGVPDFSEKSDPKEPDAK